MSATLRRTAYSIEVGLAPAEAFDFFSRVGNLNMLTPEWFRLDPTTAPPDRLAEGSVIDYRFRWRLLRLRWRTRLTDWRPPGLFTYEQERGPYLYFRHEHRFEGRLDSRGRTTLVTDVIHYRTLGGPLVARWLVEPELSRIFAHRAEVARTLFPLQTTAERPLGARPTAA